MPLRVTLNPEYDRPPVDRQDRRRPLESPPAGCRSCQIAKCVARGTPSCHGRAACSAPRRSRAAPTARLSMQRAPAAGSRVALPPALPARPRAVPAPRHQRPGPIVAAPLRLRRGGPPCVHSPLRHPPSAPRPSPLQHCRRRVQAHLSRAAHAARAVAGDHPQHRCPLGPSTRPCAAAALQRPLRLRRPKAHPKPSRRGPDACHLDGHSAPPHAPRIPCRSCHGRRQGSCQHACDAGVAPPPHRHDATRAGRSLPRPAGRVCSRAPQLLAGRRRGPPDPRHVRPRRRGGLRGGLRRPGRWQPARSAPRATARPWSGPCLHACMSTVTIDY